MHTQKAKAVKVALISPEGAPFFFWMLPLTRTEGVEILTHTLKVLIYSTVVLPGSPICKRCLNWTLRSTSKWQHAIFFLAKCVYFLPNLHNALNPFCPPDSILKEKRRKKEKEKHDTIIKNLSNYIWPLENVKMVNNIYIYKHKCHLTPGKCICRARWTPCGQVQKNVTWSSLVSAIKLGKQRESNFKFAFQTPGSSMNQANMREGDCPNLIADIRTSCHNHTPAHSHGSAGKQLPHLGVTAYATS